MTRDMQGQQCLPGKSADTKEGEVSPYGRTALRPTPSAGGIPPQRPPRQQNARCSVIVGLTRNLHLSELPYSKTRGIVSLWA
jgi:hypothetical protein